MPAPLGILFPDESESVVGPDPDATEVLWQTFNLSAGAGGFTTTDPITPAAGSAVLVMLWTQGSGAMLDLDVPVISGAGITNWKPLGVGLPQTTPTSNKGRWAFIGQSADEPAGGALTVTLDAGSGWTGNISVHEITDVYVGGDPRDCLRQAVFDKKHASNYGGSGGDAGASIPDGTKSWYPAMIDPTADANHLVLCVGFHAGSGVTVDINDSDGWELTTPGVRAATATSDASMAAMKKLGYSLGENPPMFKWAPHISSGALTLEFIPKTPDRTHRWPATVHWVADASLTSTAAVGRYPVEVEHDLVDDHWLQDMALIFVATSQEGEDWSTTPFTDAGFEVVDGTPHQTAVGSANGARHVVFWKRPAAGETPPTFSDAGSFNIIAGLMLKGVKTTGDIVNAVSVGTKTATSTTTVIPEVTTTEDQCLLLPIASRGSDVATVLYPNGPSIEWSDFVAEGPAIIQREADPTDVEGNVGENAGGNRNGEVRQGTTAGSGGGQIILSALLAAAGPSGDFTATLANTASEVYTVLAIEGRPAEAPPHDDFVAFPSAIDLDGLGGRVDRFIYEVVDPSLNVIGELNPAVTINGSSVAPQIRTSVQGNVTRRLDNLILTPTDAAAINPRTDRIRPAWVDQDGTAYPLGVHRVVDGTVVQFSGGDRVETTWADESSSHRTRIPRSLSWARDTPGADIIDELAGLLDIAVLDADPTLATIGEPLAFPVGSTDWVDVYGKVAEALGMLAPYFTNAGHWRWRHVPDWEGAEPDHVYSTDPTAPSPQRRVVQQTLSRSMSLFDAPNTWIATNTGARTAAVVGRYTLPDSAPNSVARIGVEVLAEPVDNVGFSGPDAADAAARAAAASALDDVGSASFSAPLDGRHDLYDLIEADGYRYREVGVQGRLAPGEKVSHTLRRIYLASDSEGAYLAGSL